MATSIPIEDLETGHEGFLSISLFRKLTTKMFCKKKPEVFGFLKSKNGLFLFEARKKLMNGRVNKFFRKKSVGKQPNMRR